MTKIELTIKADELRAAILILAAALEGSPNRDSSERQNAVLETEAISVPASEEKTVTLEEVRAVLANKSQSGKQKEVKALIATYGVAKLTEIEPTHFSELIQKAEQL